MNLQSSKNQLSEQWNLPKKASHGKPARNYEAIKELHAVINTEKAKITAEDDKRHLANLNADKAEAEAHRLKKKKFNDAQKAKVEAAKQAAIKKAAEDKLAEEKRVERAAKKEAAAKAEADKKIKDEEQSIQRAKKAAKK
jgi:hypothetical protein